jgi:hypothetical protein
MMDLDMLSFLDVVWESYNADWVADRALQGLSPICTQDSGFFCATTTLVYDMVVELHCSDKVQRQFGSF